MPAAKKSVDAINSANPKYLYGLTLDGTFEKYSARNKLNEVKKLDKVYKFPPEKTLYHITNALS